MVLENNPHTKNPHNKELQNCIVYGPSSRNFTLLLTEDNPEPCDKIQITNLGSKTVSTNFF